MTLTPKESKEVKALAKHDKSFHPVEEAPAPKKTTLERIVALGKRQVEMEAKKKKLAEEVKALNIAYEKLVGGFQAEGELPAAMQEAELKEFVLEDGRKITVDDELQPPSLAAGAKHRDKVLAWLKKSGNGDIIKNEIKAQFAQNDERLAKAKQALADLSVPYDNYETANAQTFKALLNEMLENGEELPLEDLGIHIYRRSKVE